MKKHLVTLHCGQQMMAVNPGQRFCNRDCAAYFVTRRSGAKKRNQLKATVLPQPNSIWTLDSDDPAWKDAKRYLTGRGYILLSVYIPVLKKSYRRLEHIVVWERCHDERLQEDWVIHHINELPIDNDPTNLATLPKRLHRELHVRLKYLKKECGGIDYKVRRYALTQEFIMRSTELADLRRQWHAA